MIEAAIALFLVYGSYEGILSVPNSAGETSTTETRSGSLSEEILEGAKLCAAERTRYRMSYPTIDYPAGDIPSGEGLCCDVVVRSLRAAGIDLQELVYEDSHAARQEYLNAALRTGFERPLNRSWIHRRTASLNLFLERNAVSLPTVYNSETAASWRPGDIVIFERNGWETWHAAIVSDVTDEFLGSPLLIDSWSSPGYTTDTHTLASYGTIGGHYRIPESLREALSEENRDRARSAWLAFLGESDGGTFVAESGVERGPENAPARSFRGFGLPFLFGGP
jgi:hypothetical protein